MSYWDGVRARAVPALLVGVVVAVVALLLVDQWRSVTLVAGAAFVAALLLPTRPSAGSRGS